MVYKKKQFKKKLETPLNLIRKELRLPEILFITTFPPRECGIATYSQDLISALKQKDYEFRLYWKNKEPWLSKNINYTGPQLSGKIMQNHDKYNFNILIDSYCKYVIDYRKNNNVIIYEPEILYKGMEISKWVNYLYPKIFGPINIELYPEFSSAFCVIVYKFLIFERKNKF